MTKPLRRHPSKELDQRLTDAQTWTNEANDAKGEFPWSNANVRVKVGYQLRMEEPLHLKLRFLTENEPNTSMHKIIIEAIEKEVALRLGKYIGEGHAGK